ncbi:MAG: hypothetical protein DMF23_14970 [Verrucomicrobia bacterium]|nr:MAG: hypothetical protein DMF23_14970 [Verrucomicrobiota bacterium]
MKQLVQHAFEGSGGEYENEYRITRPDGSIRWIAGHGSVELDERGKPAFARGVSRDITLRRRARTSFARFSTKGGSTLPAESWSRSLAMAGQRASTGKTSTVVTIFTEIPSTRTNRLQWNIACGEVTANTAGFWILEHHALPRMARSSATSAHALTSPSGSAEKKNSGWCSMLRRTP